MFISFGAHYIETTFTPMLTLFLQHQLNPFTTLVNEGANTTDEENILYSIVIIS